MPDLSKGLILKYGSASHGLAVKLGASVVDGA